MGCCGCFVLYGELQRTWGPPIGGPGRRDLTVGGFVIQEPESLPILFWWFNMIAIP